MKRLLLPASASVLVLAACGAGAKPAPRVTELAARPPTVHAIVVARTREATREAKALLRRFAAPPGARPLSRRPAGDGGVLAQSGPESAAEIVDVHRFWSVRAPLKAVAAFVRAHRPLGFARFGTEYGSSLPHYLMWGFAWPGRSRVPRRFLDVTAVALPGRTVLRVDAKAVWIYPRSPAERVPAPAREIVVRAPRVDVSVTRAAEVSRIVRWFDALPLSPPGIHLPCPLSPVTRITLSFRTADGSPLAQAEVPPTSASICDPIGFLIGGRAQRPLADRPDGASFVVRLQRLLGVRLVETYR